MAQQRFSLWLWAFVICALVVLVLALLWALKGDASV